MGPRMIRLGPEGLPDVIVIIPPNGKFLGLEVKNAKGKLRESQVRFAEKITNVGGVYRVVRSLEQAQDAVAQALGDEEWMRMHSSLLAKKNTPTA